jgi:hypothetical protein
MSNNLKHNKNLRLFLNTNKEKAKRNNRFLKIKEEKQIRLENKLKNLSIRPAIKGDYGQIDKRILPFFSVSVILKNISDKKKYKNLNFLNHQKKLIYKIIKINKKLEKLVESIKKYNLNLNSFKGSKLDFILFLRNNLYFNLKICFSNILYKIDLIKAVYNSTINNNNSINNNNFFNLSKIERLKILLKKVDINKKFYSTGTVANNKTIKERFKSRSSSKSNSTSKSSDLEIEHSHFHKLPADLSLTANLMKPKKKKNKIRTSAAPVPFFNKGKVSLLKKNKGFDWSFLRNTVYKKNKNINKTSTSTVSSKIIKYFFATPKKIFWSAENIITILNNYATLMKYRSLFPSANVLKSRVGIKNIKHLFIHSNKRLLKSQSLIKSYFLQKLSKDKEGFCACPEFYNSIKLFCKSKETEIKYLLFNLNNLIKKIEYIINIININENFVKKIKLINSYAAKRYYKNKIKKKNYVASVAAENYPLKAIYNIKNQINSNINNRANQRNKIAMRPFLIKGGKSFILSDNNNNTDLYLQISKGGGSHRWNALLKNFSSSSTLSDNNNYNNYNNYINSDNNIQKKRRLNSKDNIIVNKQVPENLIKIEKTIKTITNDDNNYKFYYNQYNNYNNNNNNNNKEYPSIKLKGIITKNFDWKIDPISVNSNPVNVLYFNNNMNKPIINHYLKSMSIYNMISKGTIMYFNNIIAYSWNKKKLRPELRTINIYKLLYSSFRSMLCLISKPVFIIKSNKIIIQLFYFLLVPRNIKNKRNKKYSYNKKYRYIKKRNGVVFNKKFKFKFNQKLLKKIIKNNINKMKKRNKLLLLKKINLINLYPLKFLKLSQVLNNCFNKPVEFDLIRLHYPYKDSNILVRLIAFLINKIKIRRITRKLYKNAVIKSIKKNYNKDKTNIIPAFLSGLTIKVAGRLMKYKVIPRKTVRIVRRGSSSTGKVNYTDFAKYTNKNRRGAFTIFIKSGHNFF